jgi:hypothetical protein
LRSAICVFKSDRSDTSADAICPYAAWHSGGSAAAGADNNANKPSAQIFLSCSRRWCRRFPLFVRAPSISNHLARVEAVRPFLFRMSSASAAS